MVWSTSNSPARASRSSPRCARPSTCRSPRTSRSGGPRTPTACATSRPPTSRCSRCSRSAACARACGSPRTSGCRSSCPAPSSPASASPPASRWRPRCPTLKHACGLATIQLLTDDVAVEPLLPVDGFLPVRPVELDDDALARLAAPPDRVAHWERRLRAVRQDLGLDLVDRLSRAASSTLLVEHGVTEIVLAPGSRNAPLAFAVYDAAQAGLVRLHTRIDERAAGFLALGLTKVGTPGGGGVHVRHRGRQPPSRLPSRPRTRGCPSSS